MISLSAILVTDIVRSTELAAELRDERWNRLRRTHDAAVRRELRRLGGREINAAGDAFLATFQEPERAIACAWSLRDVVGRLGLEIRAGIHFGRVERNGRDTGGIALHVASRVVVAAEPGEILVSSTVHDALAGSVVDFTDRGLHTLKGLPGEWRLYAVQRVPPLAHGVSLATGWRGWLARMSALIRSVAFLRPDRDPWTADAPRAEEIPSAGGSPAPAPDHVPEVAGGRAERRRRPRPAPHAQPLSRRLTYGAVCAVLLAVGVWGLLAQRSVSKPATSHETLAFPVQVQGVQVASPDELELLVQNRPPGSEVTVLDVRGRSLRLPLEPRYSWLHLLATAVCGLAFWSVGAFVFGPRMAQGYIPAFFWAFQLYALAILIGGIHDPPAPLALNSALPLLRIAALVLLPFLFTYIGLIFPRRHPLLARRHLIIPVAFAAAVALVAWYGAAFLEYVVRPRPEAWKALRAPELAAGLVLVAGDVAGCAFLYRSLRRAELDRERRQVKWILWGLATGVTPFAFLYVLPQALGFEPVIPLVAARLATLTIPVAFGIAVAKHKFLDIDLIIRRSLIYGTLAAVACGVYLLLAVWIARGLPPGSALADVLPVATSGVVVALLMPTRRAIGRWVDRTVFKIGHRHGRALRALRLRLERVWSQREVASLVRAFLDETLRPKDAAVVVRAGDELTVSEAGADLLDVLRDLTTARPGLLARPLAAPDSTSLPERETAEFPAELLEAGVLLAYPLTYGEGVLGWLLVGEKESERRFVSEDLDLLDGVAAETAAVLEHLDLITRVAEERLARQRANELDRAKSEFLMRVAHDLRTPLASISWSAQNLADGVVGAPDPRQVDYLRAITTSANRLSRLVDNLLEVSRLQGTRRLQVEPVHLDRVVSEAVECLRPVADSRAQRIEVRLEPDLPPARGNELALVEVVTNLVENALKYSPAGGSVEVELTAAEGRQVLSVRDHGPGLGLTDVADIFDAFRQGEPSPHSGPSGFGLGLFIVRSYVEMLGGTASGRTDPGGGARFTVDLPEWAVQGAPA